MSADDVRASWTTLTTRVLAPNPGLMTLDGTNTYVIRRSGAEDAVIVDPGPLDDDHLRRIEEVGAISLILLTHCHPDHAAAASRLSARTAAPVRAADPSLCIGAAPLSHGERIVAAGTAIEVMATPGHTADSVCFRLPDDGPRPSVLTGDTILGRGTTVLDGGNGGSLRDYLDTLDRLAALGHETVLPGHGAMRESIADVSIAYRAHRVTRLEQVRAVATEFAASGPPIVRAVTDRVYGRLPAAIRTAAEASVAVQLAYLAEESPAGDSPTRPGS
jgi:glyoxylase-like metal-dependent hydrolase (beta-lactamase superfamily II)